MTKQAWHDWRHDERSRRLRAVWGANPSTVCARCGMTYQQAVAAWGRRAAAWEAGHIRNSTVATSDKDYQPEHSRCNRSAGATYGNNQRLRRNSREW